MDTIDFLRAHEHKGNGDFLKEAHYLTSNWGWMKYSYAIAIKVRRRMDELSWTQKRLAESLGCTQQHISILLNGRVNMTLETLAKLEKALDFDLIGQALALTHGHEIQSEPVGNLSDPSSQEEAVSVGASSMVDGYPPRKKKGPKKKH